jgi:4-amino-4-deoxy-L-arabinose transferase-like glycosyltransferase
MIELVKGNGHVITEFIDYQIRLFKTEDSDHGGPFIYHFVVLLLGCFPSSVFFILALKKQQTDTPFQKHFKSWMLILFWVVLILFSIVQTKIVHYSSLCYFPLTYLATYSISKLKLNVMNWNRFIHWLMIGITLILGIVFVVIGLFPYLKNTLINSQLIDDVFAVENLKADVYWNGFEWLIGVFFLAISLVSIYKIKQKKFQFMYTLFFGSLLTVYSFIMIIAPKIERYSQRSSIEFYKMCAQHHYEVESIGFKSYATLFYAQFKQSNKTNPALLDYIKSKQAEYKEKGIDPRVSFAYIYTNFLIEGPINHPVCLVSKINELETITQNHPNLKLLYKENGFCFFIRKKDNQVK